uniref:DUF834 domain-containing protein n=1 Tax=Oryza sativa subsp. japonica TaxID=39947 RepID=Q33B41_ORYSJ|nr:hypothetical protein LOC_Os10g05329 [Oryza sativa Japonica Group]ABB46732.1 hypothetical protein LOC_Os10g05309 [Oryza sativa Japonica Group]
MELRWILASGRWLPGFLSFLRTQRRQRRPKAAAKAAASCGWRHSDHGGALVHDDGQPPVGFGAKQPVAEVALTLAKPREATALTGDGRGDGARRLERRRRRRRGGARGGGATRHGRPRERGQTKEED